MSAFIAFPSKSRYQIFPIRISSSQTAGNLASTDNTGTFAIVTMIH
jgi:hypothetical protein